MNPSPRTRHTLAANVCRQPSGDTSATRWLTPLRGQTHPTKRLIAGALCQLGTETLLENAA